MTDYTKLVEALRCCIPNPPEACEGCTYNMGGVCNTTGMMADAAAAIEELQAQLPKRGEWVKNEDRCGWHCSYCKVDNYYAYSWSSETGQNEFQDNYCPNCGAKMEVQE